jgi:hypothetical protein
MMEQKKIILTVLFFCTLILNVQAQGNTKKLSAFRDSTDNAYDISDWLLKKQGFLLMPVLITEPAVGYGAAAAAVIFHSR